MKKLTKLITLTVLTALSITAIVFLSIHLSDLPGRIADLEALNFFGSQDANIALVVRNIWGLSIAIGTLSLWMIKSWFFLFCKKGKRK